LLFPVFVRSFAPLAASALPLGIVRVTKEGARMSAIEAVAAPQMERPKRARSRITTGRRLWITGDSNSAWSRRYHDLIYGHVSDLGGRSNVSEAKYALCKRAAALECELEQLEGQMSLGEQVDLDKFGRAASHLRRILETLGLERRARDVTPTLAEYLQAATHVAAANADAESAATDETAPREGDT
jgi:hypothetical protein